MLLYVFNWPIPVKMIERMYLIIDLSIIMTVKSEVSTFSIVSCFIESPEKLDFYFFYCCAVYGVCK